MPAVSQLNDAEKLLVRLLGFFGGCSVALLAWIALAAYNTNATVHTLSARLTDQIATTNQRLQRMQNAIDRNTDNIQQLEVRRSERNQPSP